MRMEIPLSTKIAVKSDEETKNIVNHSEEKLPFLKENDKRMEKAAFFKALGDETRLRIIGMLAMDDLCMCEIVSGLDIPPSTISHHLKLLERGNVIQSRKEGRFTVYRLQRETVLPYLR
ncbi:metalloregulator ArsR/SmtB family transcription factor [Bacillus sp. FJAT-47783]|uniref:ArsR/SmtB family transcription factor n=1 Tax=Bacillus sp. FJAT-47783 TaxID=2922712 RepID=UPI001FAC1C91|nr:metalloregulator ArsR/SmtB family transcription factor [Bacillus sp. FJAT-47783]